MDRARPDDSDHPTSGVRPHIAFADGDRRGNGRSRDFRPHPANVGHYGNRASFCWSRYRYSQLQLIFRTKESGSAETEIESLKPPRAKYPKDPVIIQPGTTLWVHDDAIDLGEMICDNLDGAMDITVKYGLPGKEHFEIRHHGTVEIFVEPFGQYKGIYFHPVGETAVPG